MTPSESPRALITGITGQDGSYLAELLLEKGLKADARAKDGATPIELAEEEEHEGAEGRRGSPGAARRGIRRTRPSPGHRRGRANTSGAGAFATRGTRAVSAAPFSALTPLPCVV